MATVSSSVELRPQSRPVLIHEIISSLNVSGHGDSAHYGAIDNGVYFPNAPASALVALGPQKEVSDVSLAQKRQLMAIFHTI